MGGGTYLVAFLITHLMSSSSGSYSLCPCFTAISFRSACSSFHCACVHERERARVCVCVSVSAVHCAYVRGSARVRACVCVRARACLLEYATCTLPSCAHPVMTPLLWSRDTISLSAWHLQSAASVFVPILHHQRELCLALTSFSARLPLGLAHLSFHILDADTWVVSSGR